MQNPPAPKPKEIAAELRQKRALKKFRQKDMQRATGVDQSQISRIFRGDFKRISGNVEKICKYAGVSLSNTSRITTRRKTLTPKLRAAIAEAWDGEPETEEALAFVIRSLAALARRS